MTWNDCHIFPSVQTRVLARATASHGGSDDVTGCEMTSLARPLFDAAKSTADSVVTGPATTLVDIIVGIEHVVSTATADVVILALAAVAD